jgi:carbamoyltransferase
MAAVLGVSAYYHDAAAALVVDSEIVCAVQEERLSRWKNDASLPRAAIDACLRHASLDAGALDAVVYYEDPYRKIERVLVSLLRTFPRSVRQFPRAIASQLGQKLWVLDQLAEHLDLPRERIRYRRHHESHAASAFFCSPFERAAVLTVDGVGEDVSTSIWSGSGEALECQETIHYPHSLGLFYAAITAWLGFRVNVGEHKVMGLSSWGTARFEEELRSLLITADDGSFALDLGAFRHHTDVDLPFGPSLEARLGTRRRPGRPWDLDDPNDQRYADVAASLQRVTEDALVALAKRARRVVYGDAPNDGTALCLAGGVALNAVANARIAKEAGFSRVFVQPAAGDAGGALGAAVLGALELGDARPPPLSTAHLGLPVDAVRAQELAGELGLDVSRVDDPPSEIAAALEAGRIVGIASGRFEWGPRALGARSLLASSHDVETRERLNREVKHREPFRPFAPAVLAERTAEHFELPPDEMTPFMTTIREVRDPGRHPAITHVDGTARVQTVTDASAPLLAAILRAGVPVVLNTSLNDAGDPICASAEDCLAFLVSSSIDALYLEDLLIEVPRR